MASDPNEIASAEEAIDQYLELLRVGTRAEKIQARDMLGRIFEERDQLDEAVECYETNVRHGVRTRSLYQRLASVYERQGRLELASEVRAEIVKLPPEVEEEPLTADTARMEGVGAEEVRRPILIDDYELSRESSAEYPPQYATEVLAPAPFEPWYARTPVIILSLILCSAPVPVGLALMWAQARWTNNVKWVVTAIFWVVWLATIGVAVQTGVAAGLAQVGGLSGLVSTPPTPTRPSVAIGQPTVPSPPPGVQIGAASPSPAVRAPFPPGIAPSGTAVAGPQRVRIAKTEGSGASMRRNPSLDGPRIKILGEGTLLDVVGPDSTTPDGKIWRNVRDSAGDTGWVLADFLEPVAPAQPPPAKPQAFAL